MFLSIEDKNMLEEMDDQPVGGMQLFAQKMIFPQINLKGL